MIEKKTSENRIKNRGTTLVEMITTFALISLFMVAATKVISNVVSVYYSAKSISTTLQVSDIIATKIKGDETMAKWLCNVCGYVYEGDVLPDDFVCPLCKHPASDFEKVVG